MSRLTATAPPGGRRRTSNPGWPRGPPPVGASRRDLPTGCARRSPERSPGDGGSNPPTSKSAHPSSVSVVRGVLQVLSPANGSYAQRHVPSRSSRSTTSEIRQGKLDDLKEAVAELVDVRRVERGPADRLRHLLRSGRNPDDRRPGASRLRVDGASHDGGRVPRSPASRELVTLSTLDVYGEPSEALLEQLRRKASCWGRRPWWSTISRRGSLASTRADIGSRLDASRLRVASTFVTLPVRRLGSVATTTGVTLP